MSSLEYISIFKWFRVVVIALLIGVLLPVNSVSARISSQDIAMFSKQKLTQEEKNQNITDSIDVMALAGDNLIQDPSFEASYGTSVYWSQYSSNFGSPLCPSTAPSPTGCGNGGGTVGPHSGSAWVWFGGVDFSDPDAISPEYGLVSSQFVPFPMSCTITLQFYLWIGYAQPGSDTSDAFFVLVDLLGPPVFQVNATQAGSYPTYQLVTIDLSSYADGATHGIDFVSITDGQVVNFNLDDISLTAKCPVTISGNVGVSGATLWYMDGGTKTVTADGSGNYTITVPYGWSGTVTPYKTGYRFTPVYRSYNNVQGNLTNQDYTTEACSVCVSGVLRADPNPTNAVSVNFTVMFTDSVNGVTEDDFNLATTGVTGAGITGVTPVSGTTYTVTVNTGSGNGTIRLDVVDDDSIQNGSDIPLGGVGAGNGNFNGGETYTIVKTPTFGDVPDTYWAWGFIERLYNAGITSGCSVNPKQYCPTATVTRDQMAIFLLRGEHTSSYTPPTATGVFQDVPVDYWAADWIEQLAVEGITSGCSVNPKLYCPTAAVTRDQMAIFLLRAKYGSSYVPPTATGVFQDVPTNYWAADWIEQLAAEGITSGCSVTPKLYCPTTAVTRDQMAVFLVRNFNLP